MSPLPHHSFPTCPASSLLSSIKLTLIKVTNNLYLAIAIGQISILILFSLSVAVDFAHHTIFFFFLNIPSLKHSSLASVTAFSRLSLSQGKLCLFSIPGGSFSTRPAGGPWAPITAVSSSCTLSQFQGVTGR